MNLTMNKTNFCVCFLIILLLFASTGCTRDKVIDEIVVISNMGFDLEDGKILGSATYPSFDIPGHKGPDVVRGIASTNTGILTSFNNQAASPIEVGQTRIIVINERLAQKGIGDLITTLKRDPIIGSNTYLVISKDKADQILSVSVDKSPFYLSNLIKQNEENNNTPPTNLHSVYYQYYGTGQDVYIPFIKVNKNKILELDGLAIFKQDKMKMKVSQKDSIFFKLLKSKKKNGNFEFPYSASGEKRMLDIRTVNSKSKFTISDQTSKQPKVNVTLRLSCLIKDAPEDINLSDPKRMKSIQNQIEKRVSKKTKDLIISLQSKNIDPFGFGDLFRGRDRNWDEKKFYRIYPDIKFKVNVHVNLLQSGVGK
jgi:spore germination protein